jgi:uncharacterized protein
VEETIVVKCNIEGKETWRYPGEILRRDENSILLAAHFNRPDLLFHGMLLAEGDLFIEIYFTDHWFNIFEIHDRKDGSLKGWYCNVTRPAVFKDGQVSYIDLALDLLVFPDGKQIVLDEDEFIELKLNEQAQQNALAALEQLKQIFMPPINFRLEKIDGSIFN